MGVGDFYDLVFGFGISGDEYCEVGVVCVGSFCGVDVEFCVWGVVLVIYEGCYNGGGVVGEGEYEIFFLVGVCYGCGMCLGYDFGFDGVF